MLLKRMRIYPFPLFIYFFPHWLNRLLLRNVYSSITERDFFSNLTSCRMWFSFFFFFTVIQSDIFLSQWFEITSWFKAPLPPSNFVPNCHSFFFHWQRRRLDVGARIDLTCKIYLRTTTKVFVPFFWKRIIIGNFAAHLRGH